MQKDRNTILIYILLLVTGWLLVGQASKKAPAGDEVAQLAASLATVHYGHPGYYRVNPPLHKIVSGLAMELVCAPSSPIPSDPATLPPGVRREFEYSEILIAQNQKNYRRLFFVGRVVRIPIILGAALLLVHGFPRQLKIASMVACFLFLTSPMTLGHGWCIMPDAFSGCAMIFLLSASVTWLHDRSRIKFLMVGIAWGLALGTKFTFCPIYVLWPVCLIIHELLRVGANLKNLAGILASHLFHGAIAWTIVLMLYSFEQPWVPLKDHQFRSQRFSAWVQPDQLQSGEASILGHLRSPLPKQFLVGIDEQQLDLEQGFPTYILGQWYPDGVWWYYLLGLLIKEQSIFMVGLTLCPVAVLLLLLSKNKPVCDRHEESADYGMKECRASAALFGMSLFLLASILAILSSHPRMALNVRYAFPALPPAYLMIGIACQWLLIRRKLVAKIGIAIAVGVAGVELVVNAPHFFSYANPVWGGSGRIPPPLHDTNFDGGQDLWILEKYIADNSGDHTERYVVFHSRLPLGFFGKLPTPPLAYLDQLASASLASGTTIDQTEIVELIVMRGTGYPAPWTMVRPKIDDARQKNLIKLLQTPPDRMLTPTVFIYRHCIQKEN